MRLMVLGGGNCQINLIKRAKKRGHYIILVDYLKDCPASKITDEHDLISTFDIEGVIKVAENRNIDAIVTTGTDQPVLTAAVVAERLHLSFYVDSAVAKAVTNKRIMKDIFRKSGIPNVPYKLISKDFDEKELEPISFPAVLKPVDSQGQRGVFLVNNLQEVKEKLSETLTHSREDKALIEEYYENDELTVNGWVYDGNVKIISVVDRVTIRETKNIGVCLCHNFPSVHLKKYHNQIEAVTNQIVSAFSIKNGPIYFQYFVGEQGLKVNEIAMRIGGAYEDITIPLLSGVDIAGLLLDFIEKGSCDLRKLKQYSLRQNEKCLSTQLFFCRPGTIIYIIPKKDILKLSGVAKVYYAIEKGSEIKEIEDATARAGYIIVQGNSFENMIDNVNNVFNALEVRGSKSNNLVIKYSDYNSKYRF